MPAGTAPLPIPIPATDAHFHKYAEFTGQRQEWLKEIILEHQLYLPTLDQLNDPADGRPKLAAISEEKLFNFLYQVRLGKNPHMSLEQQEYERQVLEHNLKQHGAEFFTRELSKVLNNELNDWKIYCLSKRWDNLSLWAKYANDHSGCCLEFANVGPFFTSAKVVRYGEAPELDPTNRGDMDGRWFFCKREVWSNEEEVRVLIPRRSSCKFQIDPSWLTRLILGWKMAEADKQRIRGWAKGRLPELKVVSAVYDPADQTLKIAD
ncbi:MAG: DUF2971 domain-containing protein [Terracidiphilus sp.]|jgi:hypothetical protein